MKYKIFEVEHDGRKFRIEEDYPHVGTYLYVYKKRNMHPRFFAEQY
jgi:hypothetical protein